MHHAILHPGKQQQQQQKHLKLGWKITRDSSPEKPHETDVIFH